MATNGSNGSLHRPVLRAGLIGCGEIAQVAHIATLNALSDYFEITYLCDVSRSALSYCAQKITGRQPQTTTDAEELCASPNVDVVLVCNATAFHVEHAILALKRDKHVFVEKPLALCYRDIDELNAAQSQSKGRVFVGYMRRYAPALEHAIAEIGDREKIQYVRVRDILGPNNDFVNQSGMFPKRFSDFTQEDSLALSAKDKSITKQALENEFRVPMTATTAKMLVMLGALGTHDLSAMREMLGMPQRAICANLNQSIWTAIFDYGHFTVVYESGFNDVPVFDAHIEVYTPTKIVRVQYDSPYIKGLPTTVHVRERTESANGQTAYQERSLRLTYEDSYTLEFKHWYKCIVDGVKPKTTIEDAKQDIKLIEMLMQAAFQ